jgi:SAM-dependent methyltransferase
LIRALAKGTVLWAFGNMPMGPRLYRTLTRKAMGTQAGHVDKLSRVWPGYAKVWRERCGIDLCGKRLWIHEGGWTVFPFLLGHMVTGEGPVVTNEDGPPLDRYTRRALEAACEIDLGPGADASLARELLAEGVESARTVIARTKGTLIEHASPHQVSIESASIDLAHSGGTLEHYRPEALRELLKEMARILKPGGIASHIFDHRDHLYHADKRYPFLNHLRYGPLGYRMRFGHRLLYHNRLLPAEVEALFREAGFEPIATRRLILPALRYVEDGDPVDDGLVGLERERLHPRFAAATDADLRTAAAHYLFRKP